MKLKSLRQALMIGAAALGGSAAMAIAAQPAYAQEAARTYDIGAQDLNAALRQFGLITGRDVLYPPEIAAGKRSPGVHGQMTEPEALRALLAGTGLVFEQTASGGYAVQDPNSPTQLGGAAPSAAPSDEAVSEEITVIGTNIRGVYPRSSPVQIYSAEDIAHTGATTTEQFIGKLTQNFGTRTTFAPDAFGAAGTANRGAVGGADLRGLGVGTTLTLLNGRRMGLADFGRTADLSTIPADAIERVEVLTDGASAIYGSDAIGGVINFVLRKDFNGAETHISYGGVSDGGMRQGDFSQTFGRAWGSGHGLISYSAYASSALEGTSRTYTPFAYTRQLSPIDQRHNLLGSFSQDLSDRLSIGGDIAYAWRDVKSTILDRQFSNPLSYRERIRRSETEQGIANFSLGYDFSQTLHGSFKATYTRATGDQDENSTQFNRTPPIIINTLTDTTYTGLDATALLDGHLWRLPGGDARFSLGAGIFDEDFEGNTTYATNTPIKGTLGRRTGYAFGELFLPLIGAEQNIPLVEHLEVDLAARYTRFDDRSSPALSDESGNATDPKIGVLWAPIHELSFRGTYGTSFRAPSLFQLDQTSSFFQAVEGPPIPPPIGPNPNLLVVGSRPVPGLGPETATTYTLGFDIRPQAHPRLRISGTYFNISYKDRIGVPPFPSDIYTNPTAHPEIIYRAPSAAYIEALIRGASVFFPGPTSLADPAAAAATFFAGNTWIVDSRTKNLSLSEQDGFDLSLDNSFDAGGNTFRYGVALTDIMSYRQQTVPGAPLVTTVDVATRPVDLRGRVFAGLSRGGFDGTLSVNYVDDYRNIAFAIGGPAKINSWTTADLALSYAFDDTAPGVFDGVRLSLSVQNLTNEDPPFVAGTNGASEGLSNGVGFDPANANPFGRLVVVGLSKKW